MNKSFFLLFLVFVLLLSSLVYADYFGRGTTNIFEESNYKEPSIYKPIITSPIFIVVLVGLSIFTFFKTKKNKKNLYIIPGLWVIYVIFLLMPTSTASTSQTPDWIASYQQQLSSNMIPSEYTAETDYYDFSNSIIKSEIDKISASNEDTYVASVLDLVYNNVKYNLYENDDICLNSKASQIFAAKTGQCDTQSMVIVAFLRGKGIAARSVGGCIAKNDVCNLKQSLIQAVGIEFREPVWTEVKPIAENETAGRGGGLHAWVEYWSPEKGWVPLESTTGNFADTTCYNYMVEKYPSNEDKLHLCVSTSATFVNMCAIA